MACENTKRNTKFATNHHICHPDDVMPAVHVGAMCQLTSCDDMINWTPSTFRVDTHTTAGTCLRY